MATISENEAYKDIPTSGIIRIAPFRNSLGRDQATKHMFWGHRSVSAHFTIGGKKVEDWNFMGSNFTINGAGMILDMTNYEHRKIYAIITKADQLKGVVSTIKDKRVAGNRFYIDNPEKEMAAYLEGAERQDEYNDIVRSLSDRELEICGLWFSIKGTNQFIKASLRKMNETEEGRKKFGSFMLNSDKEFLQLIAVAEERSKPTAGNKEGLYQTANGVYYWNTTAIGAGKEQVVLYLKKNTDLYREMRNMFMGAEPAVEAVVTNLPKETVVEKKLQAIQQEPKVKEPSADEKTAKIIELYNGGEKSTKILGRHVDLHWKSVEKILKENADKLTE